MSFTTFKRTAKLPREIEDQLQIELAKRIPLGESAKQIARELHFGEPGLYATLKIENVWSYRGKFNDPLIIKQRGYKPFGLSPQHKGGCKKGSSHYKNKREETMSFEEFKTKLNAGTIPPGKKGYNTDYNRRKRAWLILQYWAVLRKSEIYERLRKDFTIEGDLLKIRLLRKKKYHKPKEYKKDADQEPFYIPIAKAHDMLMDEVLSWLDTWGDEERPFNFEKDTAWNYTRDVFPGLYCHFFRADWISKTVDRTKDEEGLITKLLRDTRLDIRTVVNYILSESKTQRCIRKRIGRTGVNDMTTAIALADNPDKRPSAKVGKLAGTNRRSPTTTVTGSSWVTDSTLTSSTIYKIE